MISAFSLTLVLTELYFDTEPWFVVWLFSMAKEGILLMASLGGDDSCVLLM